MAKFKLGDKVFFMKDNKVTSMQIWEIFEHSSLSPCDNYGTTVKTEVMYYDYGAHTKVTEDKVYATKEELLASL